MDIKKLLHVVVFFCVLSEGLAWWGRSRSSSSSRSTSRRSSSRSSSSRRGTGLWGRRRNQSPKPARSGKHKSGWWSGQNSGRRRNQPSKPASSGKDKSGWWFWKRKPATSAPIPVPKPTPRPAAPKPKFEDTKKVIEGFETLKLKVYDAQPHNPDVYDTTIGIGFNLNRPDAKETFKKVLPDVDFDKVKSGEQEITEDEARALFNYDIDNIYVPKAKRLVGEDLFNSVPSNVQTALVNAGYRGDLLRNTAELMKQGKWEEAVKTYLEQEQYKNADELRISGVKKRMDWNKEQFDTMIEKEKQDPK
ncbi:uncharacterized protein LOC128552271 isoform X2 [Mercenaria mercenaria]|uniref:uncharacterized protein LOC128552271 isoform X2 n=1 Tax=Mercenaria mercenaria TaxID=6596 RepID=UPI00234E961E|nr:uncharacterized protein LOC128552271 isoform X2 [Mercenaria mercenaria]